MIDAVIQERGGTHGDYRVNASISQQLKMVMHDGPNWEALTATQKESMHLMATKMARILAGNPHCREHWVDLSGYPMLIAKELGA